jgi:hypothetical protein
MIQIQRERKEQLIFLLGQLFGLLSSPDIKEYLRERGVTESELRAMHDAQAVLIKRLLDRPDVKPAQPAKQQ